jgi:hypothetical protein
VEQVAQAAQVGARVQVAVVGVVEQVAQMVVRVLMPLVVLAEAMEQVAVVVLVGKAVAVVEQVALMVQME